MGELASTREKVDALETSVQASDSRVETMVTDALPSITSHISSITTALAMRQLELEVHRRKWALIINGIKGPASEREDDTRAACISLANDILKVPKAGNTRISACHGLSQTRASWSASRTYPRGISGLWTQITLKVKTSPLRLTSLLSYENWQQTFWPKEKNCLPMCVSNPVFVISGSGRLWSWPSKISKICTQEFHKQSLWKIYWVYLQI